MLTTSWNPEGSGGRGRRLTAQLCHQRPCKHVPIHSAGLCVKCLAPEPQSTLQNGARGTRPASGPGPAAAKCGGCQAGAAGGSTQGVRRLGMAGQADTGSCCAGGSGLQDAGAGGVGGTASRHGTASRPGAAGSCFQLWRWESPHRGAAHLLCLSRSSSRPVIPGEQHALCSLTDAPVGWQVHCFSRPPSTLMHGNRHSFSASAGMAASTQHTRIFTWRAGSVWCCRPLQLLPPASHPC